MSIFAFDYKTTTDQLTPPLLRKPIRLSWLYSLAYPIQKRFNDDLGATNSYKKGFIPIAKWSAALPYTTGTKIRYGIKVYEALKNSTGVVPYNNPTTWQLISNDFVGADSRAKFNNGKMLFEYVLNLYLNTTAYTVPAIYIQKHLLEADGFYLGVDGDTVGMLGTNVNQSQFLGTAYILDQRSFTVWVPITLANSLYSGTPDVAPAISSQRENIVRGVVDKYNTVGSLYYVKTY
jgi:hypothetical protein